MYVINNVQDTTTYKSISNTEDYECITVTQVDNTIYVYTVKKNNDYPLKPKKEELPEAIEWRNNMFRGYKEWQNKLLSEKKSLNVSKKVNRNHIKIRNRLK